MKSLIKISALATLTSIVVSTAYAASETPPLSIEVLYPGKFSKAEKPIKDKQGRIRYIVDLVDEPLKALDTVKSKADFVALKKSESEKSVSKLLRDNAESVELLAFTSFTGTRFFAYLNEQQAEKLAKDKRVRLITQDRYGETSNWPNTTLPSGDFSAWGRQAMRVDLAPPAIYNANVYVIDTGAELHPDLQPNLSAANRVNAIDALRVLNGQPSTNTSPIGCWSHATHVAGIIGARQNGAGVVGMAPNVTLYSYAATDVNYALAPAPDFVLPTTVPWPVAVCAGATFDGVTRTGNLSIMGVLSAMELAALHIMQHGTGVVNMSFNFPNYIHSFGTIGYATHRIATPYVVDLGFGSIYYKGAFVVQSAGNQGGDACPYVYRDTFYGGVDSSDGVINGVMVVGGLHSNLGLTQVNPGDGSGPYVEPSIIPFNPAQGNFVGGTEPGTNYGGCVETWAPSNKIRSTWTNGTYQQLSGTSMAAPYVSGFAARILQNTPNLNSQQLEDAVRQKFRDIGPDGWNPSYRIYMPDFGV